MNKRKETKSASRKNAVKASGLRSPGRRGWATPDEQLYKPIKRPVTLRLDADVLAWFKGQGRGYQTRINRALRSVMMKEK